jgi:hypothetical protein
MALPAFADHFFVGNAWDWEPPCTFRYVYALYDGVPLEFLAEYVARLLSRAVVPHGRLIVGAYGSRSRQLPPLEIAEFLSSAGFAVAGTSQGGTPTTARYAPRGMPG